MLLLILIISDVHKYLSSLRMKAETESTNRGRVYLDHELNGEAAFGYSIYRLIPQRSV